MGWPVGNPLWEFLIHNAGLWVPQTWKLCHLAVCRTFLAGETSIPRKTPTPSEDIHTKILGPDLPPGERPQLSPPQSLTSHWPISPAILPGQNTDPRLRVQALDPRCLTPNYSYGWKDQSYGRTQPLSQEETISLGAIYNPRSEKLPSTLKTPTAFEDIHTKILVPDVLPEQRSQLSPPQTLTSHWQSRPPILPGLNPSPTLCVQALDSGGLTPNSCHGWEHQTDGRTQALSRRKGILWVPSTILRA